MRGIRLGCVGVLVSSTTFACGGAATRSMSGGGNGGASGTANVSSGGSLPSGNGGNATSGEAPVGTGGAPANATNGASIEANAWKVKLSVTSVDASNGSPPFDCTNTLFDLEVDRSVTDGQNGVAWLSSVGNVQQSTLAANGATYALSDGQLVGDANGDCSSRSFNTFRATFTAVDLDGDGIADQLNGKGNASVSAVPSNGEGGSAPTSIFTYNLTFTLSGVPDREPPALSASTMNPLGAMGGGGFLFSLSKPVSLGNLTLNGNPKLVLSSAIDGPTSAFSVQSVLPFSGTWQLEGSAQDTFGQAPTGAFRTLADPGIFSADGFEGAVVGVLDGNAAIVANVGTLTALAGNASLLVPSDSSATFHMNAPAGSHALKFSSSVLHALGPTSAEFSFGVEVGIVGASAPSVFAAQSSGENSLPTNDAALSYFTPTAQSSFDLPSGASDLIVRITPPRACPFAVETCTTSNLAVLLDDLRIE